jgi:hypothetical protein
MAKFREGILEILVIIPYEDTYHLYSFQNAENHFIQNNNFASSFMWA